MKYKPKTSWRLAPSYPPFKASSDGRVCVDLEEGCEPVSLRFAAKDYAVVYHKAVPDTRRKFLYVHVLVADAFLGPRPPGLQVNHKDRNPRNNAAENLEYVTPSENTQHGYAMGRQSPRGEGRYNSKLTEADVRFIHKQYAMGGTTITALASQLGVARQTVSAVLRGASWTHVANGGKGAP